MERRTCRSNRDFRELLRSCQQKVVTSGITNIRGPVVGLHLKESLKIQTQRWIWPQSVQHSMRNLTEHFEYHLLLTTCLHAGFLLNLFFRPWRWRRYIPPKRRLQLNRIHGVTSQKMILCSTFIHHLVTRHYRVWILTESLNNQPKRRI
jgi:hypothetical protein